MSTKYHPKYRTAIDRKGFKIKVAIPLRDCPACIQKCGYCRWPFTLSTAQGRVEELFFCSQDCAQRGLTVIEPEPPAPARRSHWKHYD